MKLKFNKIFLVVFTIAIISSISYLFYNNYKLNIRISTLDKKLSQSKQEINTLAESNNHLIKENDILSHELTDFKQISNRKFSVLKDSVFKDKLMDGDGLFIDWDN